MRHIISVLLANEAGALSRVAGLFSARGYNIESLTVAPTQTPSVSRLTLTTTGSDEVSAQINKQLQKLVDVVDLADWTEGGHIEREILLLITSTTGLGDIPQNLEEIFEELTENRPDLSQLRFGLIGLGDRNYADTFCGAPKKWKELLEAGRLVTDVDLETRTRMCAPNKCCSLIYTVCVSCH